MEQYTYIIEDIQGDYAQLRQTDVDDPELFPVAMALLPPGCDVGTKLSGMMGMFELID